MKIAVKLSIMALALAQMMICACAVSDIEESTVNLPEEGETVFSAVMELTKTAPSAGGVVSWTEDDEIGVYDGASYVKARILSVDGSNISFSAKVDPSARKYVAVTPYDAALSDGKILTEGSKIKVAVGSPEQSAGKQVVCIAETASSDESFAFRNVGNILRFQVNSPEVCKVRIVGNNGEMLGGSLWVDPSSGVSTGELTTSAVVADVIPGKDSFIALGPGVCLSEGFTITLYKDQECSEPEGEVSASSPLMFTGDRSRNQMINLGPLDGRISTTKRDFHIFDCWSAYKGKPDDMSADKFSRCHLAYESFLLGNDKEVDKAKVRQQIQIARLLGVRHVFTDIEDWYSTKDGESIKTGLSQVFDEFRIAIPDCQIGNYGVPVSDLNVRRYSASSKTRTEEEIQAEWITSSQRRMPAAEASDVLTPSMYTHTDGSGADPITQYEKDVKLTADYIRTNFPGKKIYAYIWPQFYNQHTSPVDSYQQFMTKEQWARVLEVCYEHFDGVILWCHGKGPDGEEVIWSDSRVQEVYAATKNFVAKHYDNIAVAAEADVVDEEIVPTEFDVFADLGFVNTPRNLLKFGVRPINLIKELSVSDKDKVNGVLPPDLAKVRHVAKHASNPVIFLASTWLTDRSSDNAAMVQRFAEITAAFKARNKTVTLGYRGVGPTALTELLARNYATEYDRINSWLRYAAEPCRALRQYADVICPIVTLINDDLDVWKRDCAGVFEEARLDNPGKKIYACLGTRYYGNSGDGSGFADTYSPIKEETLVQVLEYLYLRCDGVILFDNGTSATKVNYSEDLGFMKALARFYAGHKSVIDRTLPASVADEDDIPPYVEDDKVYREYITNGGFEDDIVPSYIQDDWKCHNASVVRLARLAGYFDTTAQTTRPTTTSGTIVPEGTWFHRCYNKSYFWHNFIDDIDTPYINSSYGIPYAHTGRKSSAMYAADGAGENIYSDHTGNLQHLFGIGQTLALDDDATYVLKFWYYRPSKLWHKQNNNVRKIMVGIVSSTGTTTQTDYTYEQEIVLSKTDEWTECSVTFDLPEIISANPGKSFEKCAIFINIVPELDPSTLKTLRCQVNIDDVSIDIKQ